MSKPIRFTRHLEQKLPDLAAVGFAVTREQVVDAVRQPDHVDQRVDPPVAQKAIDERHLLRVVFVEEDDSIRTVTFYPARKVRLGLKMRYDQEDDVLMIWFAEGKTMDHAEQTGGSILHVSEENEPVLLEILNARQFVVDLVATALSGSTTPTAADSAA